MTLDTAFTALIVDDEALSRDGVRVLLERFPDIRIVGECADGQDAIETIAKIRPDVVFLDIQMPEVTGFDVVRALRREHAPKIVFVTAYDEFAINAFETHALDYLLKPIGEERFNDMIDHVRAHLRQERASDLSDRIVALLQSHDVSTAQSSPPSRADQDDDRYVQRLSIKLAGRVTIVDVADIDWIEAADAHVYIHVGETKHVMRSTITAIEQRLDPQRFIRVHRSTLVNLDRVRAFDTPASGEPFVTLANGKQLAVSRRRFASLRDRLDLDA